ncbi:MAG: O-methyltransferase [Nitrososphaerales archaeon]
MNEDLTRLLAQIYEYGTDHDFKIKNHTEQMLNITPDTGVFLSILIQAIKANSILEIGTSNGYSTIWIADALRSIGGGRVTTVEVSEKKMTMAKENFQKSGLSRYIISHQQDARVFLRAQVAESADLVFLDAERPQYVSYWNDIDRVLKTGGLLVVDNALSPKPEELVDFLKLLNGSGRYLSLTVPIGKGEMIALKQQQI